MTELRRIAARDAGFRAALTQAGLPIGDLDAEPASFYALCEGGAALAFGGITEGGPDRLLRSIVVPAARGGGLGSRITSAIVDMARADGAEHVWLLTTDAAAFFSRLGWRSAERLEAPEIIRRSAQFAGLCPASATLMVRALRS